MAALFASSQRYWILPATRPQSALGSPAHTFVLASADSSPELIGGEILAGALNVGKPTEERRLLAALDELVRS
ncbi:hypothetical protein [Sinorhizobium meliloti]|uniref:hypothetical protein n=1 Tax=Rhizobium meliloti TaxID=382 RepID=UPI001F2EE407|nr:hypothetical protein [Sinorhizobium meliloti]